uniref:Uncharacterized protein n=1 Tax=Trichogramma kaykai TaxID=54128 RepID=A0ABD2WTM8_9HYME
MYDIYCISKDLPIIYLHFTPESPEFTQLGRNNYFSVLDMPETIESLSGAIAEREKPSSSSRSGKNRRVKIAWTKDDSAKLEPDDAPVQNILLEQLKFCCDNSSLTGYKYITERKRTRFERPLPIEGLPKHEQYKIEKLGVINGLTFLLEPLLDDYFFPFLPLNGWKIMIFNSGDYPDNTSGGVSEALISPGTENYLTLDAVSFYSEPSVRRFDVHDRKCIFADEISALYDGYTYSDCIVECKVDDVWRTCNCHPFFYPQRDSRRVCNTSDVKCLQKYNSKWWSVLPHDMKQGDDEAKTFNFISNESWSLRCKNCYPSCDDVHYYLTTSSVKLEKTSSQISFLRDVNIVNQSLVHIFFSKYGTVRLKQDIAYYWYELLSK